MEKILKIEPESGYVKNELYPKLLEKIKNEIGAEKISSATNVALVSIAGHQLAQTPGIAGKMFHAIRGMICHNMKRISLGSVLSSLEGMRYEVTIPEDVMRRARIPLERMMAIGRGD